jgi:hypothetical protein
MVTNPNQVSTEENYETEVDIEQLLSDLVQLRDNPPPIEVLITVMPDLTSLMAELKESVDKTKKAAAEKIPTTT